MRPLNIAIVGYGTAGQTASILLARDGHAVQVFERSPALKPLGAGLLLQPSGLAVLQELGLSAQAMALGARIDALHGVNQRGGKVMDMRYRDLSPELFGLGIQRGALFELLRSADPQQAQVRLGVTLQSVDRANNCLIDIDARRYGPFDLIVLADGTHSQLRASFNDLVRSDRPYPWGAVWCLVDDRRAQSDPGRSLLQQRYRAAREMLGLLPVGKLVADAADVADANQNPVTQQAREKICVFWSLPVAKFAEWEFHGLGNWRSAVHQLWPEAAELLLQIQHPNAIAKASYRDVVLRSFCTDRVVFLGDSAHGMSPQLGQGANMALLDARELARSLREQTSLQDALRHYSTERRAHVTMYQRLSRWLTPLFQSELAAAAWLRDLSFYPFSNLPPFKQQTLKVLAGLQRGWFGRYLP
jgi:2-polyprenyl-6-methoxyphenol hydroxylase-like FAD-dependent oxidoreductase